MNNRIELQMLLESILGNENVYYQPPSTILLKYPAIIYSRSDIVNINANNNVYKQTNRYLITVIDKNPDSDIPEKISKLSMCNFERCYVSDNLNHYVFNLYF